MFSAFMHVYLKIKLKIIENNLDSLKRSLADSGGTPPT